MLKQTIHHFNQFVDAKDALIADQCIGEARAGKTIAQNDLTTRIHNRTYDVILGDNSIPDLTRERLREQSRAGAMSWLKPRFWEQRMLIRSEAFPLLLQRAIGLPMAPPESDCPRCEKREDMYVPDTYLGMLPIWSIHHEPPQPRSSEHWPAMEVDRPPGNL